MNSYHIPTLTSRDRQLEHSAHAMSSTARMIGATIILTLMIAPASTLGNSADGATDHREAGREIQAALGSAIGDP